MSAWTPLPIQADLMALPLVNHEDIRRAAERLRRTSATINRQRPLILGDLGESGFASETGEIRHQVASDGSATLRIPEAGHKELVVRLHPIGLGPDALRHPLTPPEEFQQRWSVRKSLEIESIMACADRAASLLEAALEPRRILPVADARALRTHMTGMAAILALESRERTTRGFDLVWRNHDGPTRCLVFDAHGRGAQDALDDERRALWSRAFPPVMSIIPISNFDVGVVIRPMVVDSDSVTGDPMETLRLVSAASATLR